jgi:coenzyme F420-0:L-glutamate ligase/coenzyme F420-1:gamma-L-glutamate ligase
MSIADEIRARRSIRGLAGPPLAEAEVEQLVSLALTAPAPHHTTPWRFAHVGPERRASLADAMGEVWRADMERDGVPVDEQRAALARSRDRVLDAPTLLVGCLAWDGLRRYDDARRRDAEWGMARHSFGAAMQNILLEASARGLGAYWLSAPGYAAEAVRAALDLDEGWEPQAAIALGHPSAGYRPFDRPAPDVTGSLVWR